jgi:hypothetical protein
MREPARFSDFCEVFGLTEKLSKDLRKLLIGEDGFIDLGQTHGGILMPAQVGMDHLISLEASARKKREKDAAYQQSRRNAKK